MWCRGGGALTRKRGGAREGGWAGLSVDTVEGEQWDKNHASYESAVCRQRDRHGRGRGEGEAALAFGTNLL